MDERLSQKVETKEAREHIHGLLRTAEQSLAEGQLQAARAAADEIRTLKADAGVLPKPTAQRLSRLSQQLVELESWESFGQRDARLRLCERAEALVAQPADAPQTALEVRQMRNEWKALDQQHAGISGTLWKRFDDACEKAYAPAARHFAEVAARRKQARRQREEFIAAAAAHAPTWLSEPCDWPALERWLRDTDQTWREGNLGSVETGAWKKLDARLKAELAPLRAALAMAREQAKAGRLALIEEAAALATRALERDAPSQIRAIQARWQSEVKALALAQRDERALWKRFRAACDAVFEARDATRKEEDNRKLESRRALQDLCARLEQLAQTTDQNDADVRRVLREVQGQWKNQNSGTGPELRGIEARFRSAVTSVEAALSARARSRDAAVWQNLAAKERLCEALDGVCLQHETTDAAPRAAEVQERWAALPVLPAAWERDMAARRDAALGALRGAAVAADYLARIENGAGPRRDSLLELELLLGLESPAEFQTQRLALQVRQLQERFKSAPMPGVDAAAARLLAWCAQPGIADARDRQRCERIFSNMKPVR